jgi:hypothetical protein
MAPHLKYPLFFSDFNENRIHSKDFRKIHTQISNLIKICPVEAELFQANGRTETTKLIADFRNFANAPKSTQTSVFSSQKTLGITRERQLLNAIWGKKSLLTEGIMHNLQIQNCDKVQIIRFLCLVMETTLTLED